MNERECRDLLHRLCDLRSDLDFAIDWGNDNTDAIEVEMKAIRSRIVVAACNTFAHEREDY